MLIKSCLYGILRFASHHSPNCICLNEQITLQSSWLWTITGNLVFKDLKILDLTLCEFSAFSHALPPSPRSICGCFFFLHLSLLAVWLIEGGEGGGKELKKAYMLIFLKWNQKEEQRKGWGRNRRKDSRLWEPQSSLRRKEIWGNPNWAFLYTILPNINRTLSFRNDCVEAGKWRVYLNYLTHWTNFK